MPTTDPKRRLHLTPGHCMLALLAVEFLLFLSQWFRWLPKGWPVLIAVASVGVVVLGMFVWFGLAMVFGRRFQFSIRSLLVLTVVVALPCSWMAVDLKKAREQQEAVELFSASDCIVWGDDVTDDDGALDADKLGGDWLLGLRRPLCDEPPLVRLMGWDFFHTATAVYHENSWSRRFGEFDKTRPIQGYNSFRFGEDRAKAMLLTLKNLPDLRALDLWNVPVSDSGLAPVAKLKELRRLNLTGTQVTDEGVAKLQQTLPNCKITR